MHLFEVNPRNRNSPYSDHINSYFSINSTQRIRRFRICISQVRSTRIEQLAEEGNRSAKLSKDDCES